MIKEDLPKQGLSELYFLSFIALTILLYDFLVFDVEKSDINILLAPDLVFYIFLLGVSLIASLLLKGNGSIYLTVVS